MSIKKYSENLYAFYNQQFTINEVLYEDRSDCQDIILFRNDQFGRVLALDNVIQTTEADEAYYHEMMVHVPLLTFDNPQNILVVGGGDGGIIREVLKHPITTVTMVEIDDTVVEFSKKYLPNHSQNAFNDKRLNLVITDGAKFVKETTEKYDIIIVDSTDPIGPGAVLFTQEFYNDCHNILKQKGILVTQNGVPFFQKEELIQTYERQSAIFDYSRFYVTVVPTYVGGFMALSFASDSDYSNLSLDKITKRYQNIGFKQLYYYTPAIHLAAFTLPAFIKQALK